MDDAHAILYRLVVIIDTGTHWTLYRPGLALEFVDGFQEASRHFPWVGLAGLLVVPFLQLLGLRVARVKVEAQETTHWDEGDLVLLVAYPLQELEDVGTDEVVPCLVPFHDVELVDRNDQLVHSDCPRQDAVASGLASFYALLVGTLASIEDENGSVCLTSTLYHVGDEVTVTGAVEHRDVVAGSLEVGLGDIDRDAVLPLFLVLVHEEGELEGGLAVELCLLPHFIEAMLVDGANLV